MTQGTLQLEALSPRTFTERVAALFKARPNQWIDAHELQRAGGAFAWRTRVADCRKAPYGMTIENRCQRVSGDRSHYTVSEYRYVSHS